MCKRLRISFPPIVSLLIDTLEQAGFEAYAVGGCVRDSLRGITPADWDICTNAQPDQICGCFAQYHLIHTGIKHGTVTVVLEQQTFEITTYRSDGAYTDHRRPDCVCFSDSLYADLARRDFTVNAMACHPRKGLIDAHNGEKDLQSGVIRCVGDPNIRLQEDALRILRALRFAAVYDFSIVPSTADAIHLHAPLLKCVATERIMGELCKLLCGVAAHKILHLFPDVVTMAIPLLHPRIRKPDFLEDWAQVIAVIAHAEGNLEIALSELAYISVKPDSITENTVLDWAKQLKLDRITGREIALLTVNRHTPIPTEDRGLKHMMWRLGAQQTMQIIAARRAHMLAQGNCAAATQMQQTHERARQFLQNQICYNRTGLAVNGEDLKKIGITNGKTIGNLLDRIVLWVIEEEVENKKSLILNRIMQES